MPGSQFNKDGFNVNLGKYGIEFNIGEMPEWLNGTVSKTVVRATVPRVRIPLSPPSLAEASSAAKMLRRACRTSYST